MIILMMIMLVIMIIMIIRILRSFVGMGMVINMGKHGKKRQTNQSNRLQLGLMGRTMACEP